MHAFILLPNKIRKESIPKKMTRGGIERPPEGVVVDDQEGELGCRGECGRERAAEVVEGDAHIHQRGVHDALIPIDPFARQHAQAIALDIQRLQVGVGGQRTRDATCVGQGSRETSLLES